MSMRSHTTRPAPPGAIKVPSQLPSLPPVKRPQLWLGDDLAALLAHANEIPEIRRQDVTDKWLLKWLEATDPGAGPCRRPRVK